MKTILPVLLLCLVFIAHASAAVVMPVSMVSSDCPHHAGQMSEIASMTTSSAETYQMVMSDCGHCGSSGVPANSSPVCDSCTCAGIAGMLHGIDLPVLLSQRISVDFISPLTILLSQPPPQLLRPPRS